MEGVGKPERRCGGGHGDGGDYVGEVSDGGGGDVGAEARHGARFNDAGRRRRRRAARRKSVPG